MYISCIVNPISVCQIGLLTEVKVPNLCSYRKWVVATAKKELGLALAGHETDTIAQQRRLFA